MMIEEVIANIEDYSLWDYKGYRICKEEAETIVEGLKELKAYRELTTEDAIAKEKAKFKKELKELVAQKLEEINHYISGVDTPCTDKYIRYNYFIRTSKRDPRKLIRYIKHFRDRGGRV